MDPPPQPPPHGNNQQNGRSGGLPPGNYDIFVIPPHSSGSGFLYLPSLQTNRNSFLAGAACTALIFFVWSVAVPVAREKFNSLMTTGGPGIMGLVLIVAIAAWALGKTQGEGSGPTDSGPRAGTGGGAPQPGPSHGHAHPGGSTHVPPPQSPPPPNPGAGPRSPPKSSWQRPNPQTSGPSGGAKSSWEKAREETRKKEEERKKAEEAKRRREDAEKERQRQREKDAKEREERERKQKADREEREKRERERKEKEEAAARAKERASPKKPPYPTARTETEDDAYSFRPYDRAKRQTPKTGSAGSTYSASSYAASQTTARTTPPPSRRGPYSTNDPDKIIIKAVYSFNNAFQRTPIAQLISGQGNMTDGLILRITSEGLFIDDDVREQPQREWDVKAWTIKMAEVWCTYLLEGSPSLHIPPRSLLSAFPERAMQATFRQMLDELPSQETLDRFGKIRVPSCTLVQLF